MSSNRAASEAILVQFANFLCSESHHHYRRRRHCHRRRHRRYDVNIL